MPPNGLGAQLPPAREPTMPRPAAGRVTTRDRPADGHAKSHTPERRAVSCSALLDGAGRTTCGAPYGCAVWGLRVAGGSASDALTTLNVISVPTETSLI
jgi:hypothetical protein